MRARKQRSPKAATILSARQERYRHLTHGMQPQALFSDDKIAALHDAALRGLEELGIAFALPEAREIFAKAGAKISDEMVYIGRDIVKEALANCPKEITLKAPNPLYDKA